MRVLAGLLGFGLVFLAAGCAEEIVLPDELIGTYTTRDRRYADRSLELTSVEVVFGLGDAGLSRHIIESVSREIGASTVTYTLAYSGEGGAEKLVFSCDDEMDGSIVLQNPSITWTKQEANP